MARIGSKLLQMAPNATKFVQIGSNWFQIGYNRSKLIQIGLKGQLGLNMAIWVQMSQ